MYIYILLINYIYSIYHTKLKYILRFGKHSLLVQSGEAHGRLRRLVQMAMTPRAVEKYNASIDSAIDDFLKACQQEQGYFPIIYNSSRYFA